jgi:predicted transcriptional regulator of viral defense system
MRQLGARLPRAAYLALVSVTIFDELAKRGPNSKRLEDAYVALSRAAALAGRPRICIIEPDLPNLDVLTGSRARSHDLLAALERAGRIHPVRRGAYVLVSSTGNVGVSVLDLVAALTPEPYLVTAGRALQFHNLTDQHFRLVVVLVRKQARSWSWRRETVRYSRTDRPFRPAITRSKRTRAVVATPERALADSLENPSFGVTLAQVAEALDSKLQQDAASADRLASVIADGYGHASARRFGFLVAHLADETAARGFLPLRGRSKAATLLLKGGPTEGPVDPVWNVRQNVDLTRLTQHRRS